MQYHLQNKQRAIQMLLHVYHSVETKASEILYS